MMSEKKGGLHLLTEIPTETDFSRIEKYVGVENSSQDEGDQWSWHQHKRKNVWPYIILLVNEFCKVEHHPVGQ